MLKLLMFVLPMRCSYRAATWLLLAGVVCCGDAGSRSNNVIVRTDEAIIWLVKDQPSNAPMDSPSSRGNDELHVYHCPGRMQTIDFTDAKAKQQFLAQSCAQHPAALSAEALLTDLEARQKRRYECLEEMLSGYADRLADVIAATERLLSERAGRQSLEQLQTTTEQLIHSSTGQVKQVCQDNRLAQQHPVEAPIKRTATWSIFGFFRTEKVVSERLVADTCSHVARENNEALNLTLTAIGESRQLLNQLESRQIALLTESQTKLGNVRRNMKIAETCLANVLAPTREKFASLISHQTEAIWDAERFYPGSANFPLLDPITFQQAEPTPDEATECLVLMKDIMPVLLNYVNEFYRRDQPVPAACQVPVSARESLLRGMGYISPEDKKNIPEAMSLERYLGFYGLWSDFIGIVCSSGRCTGDVK